MEVVSREMVSKEDYDFEHELREEYALLLFTCRVRLKDIVEMLEPYATDKARDEKVDLTVKDLSLVIDMLNSIRKWAW